MNWLEIIVYGLVVYLAIALFVGWHDWNHELRHNPHKDWTSRLVSVTGVGLFWFIHFIALAVLFGMYVVWLIFWTIKDIVASLKYDDSPMDHHLIRLP